jgi:hypothetical protein
MRRANGTNQPEILNKTLSTPHARTISFYPLRIPHHFLPIENRCIAFPEDFSDFRRTVGGQPGQL